MLLERMYWKFKDRNLTHEGIEAEIAKIKDLIEKTHSHVSYVYSSSDIFDGLGKTAGGYLNSKMDLLKYIWSRRDSHRARLENLEELLKLKRTTGRGAL